MDKVVFHEPVFVGDLVSLHAEVERKGRTSITMRVTVCAQAAKDPNDLVIVTGTTVTYVNTSDDGQPVAIDG